MMQTKIEGYRLSPQQDRLWDLRSEALEHAYHAACVLSIEVDLDPEDVAAALRQVVERHEILRMGFRRLPGMERPLQVVGDAACEPPALRDLTALDPEEQKGRIDAICEELGRTPFDLEKGSVLRTSLVKLAADRWALALVLPALCADAPSLVHLAGDLARSWAGSPAGSTEESAEPVQYVDVATWWNELLESQEGLAHKFWQQRDLGGALDLRLDIEPAPASVDGFAPRRLTIAAPQDLLAKVEAVAGSSGVSLTAVLLGAWQVLLGRLSGLSKLVVGTAYDGRRYEEMTGGLGPFTRFLPVECELTQGATFAEIVRQADSAIAELNNWQELFSWSSIDGAAQERFLPYCFEVLPVLPRSTNGKPWFAVDRLWAHIDRFRIKLSCTVHGDHLALDIHYDERVCASEEAARLGAWYGTLLEDAVSRPETPISELALMPEPEHRRLLLEVAPGPSAAREDWTLSERCEAQALHTPDAVAISYGDRGLTFAALDAWANRIARRLRRLGVGPEVRVALCLERSFEMVAAMLGVLKAGGAYLPLDPGDPGARLRWLIEHTQATVLLTQEHLLTSLGEVKAQVLCLDGQVPVVETEPASPLSQSATPNNLAYVIHTSGSTGHPKGVMVTHRAILNRLLWMQDTFPLTGSDRVLQKTPYTFDASIWEIFVPLLSGARLVLAEPGGHKDRGYLLRTIEEAGVTVAQFVPSLLSVYLDQDEAAIRGCGLRRVFCGGEAFPRELAERLSERLDSELCNLYGPTETAIDATFHTCTPEAISRSKAILPIGRPLANVQVYPLDSGLQLVPAGRSGELYIGGAGLARGYLGRPDLTAERFVPHPWASAPGERLYRTGDLVRLDAGGTIEFLGRVDQQVKVRGFRIELGEIESALLRHPLVEEAAVVAREDTPGDQRLAAYVVAASQELSFGELRDLLAGQLPEHMVPASFVLLPALPRTSSGKIDRRALPAPDLTRPAIEQAFMAPRTQLEGVLAGIWGEVLRLDRVGIHDSFFDLGGHSLIAARVISRVREICQVEVRVRKLFEAPTVAELAIEVEKAIRAAAGLEAPPLVRSPRRGRDELPLSYPQQRLWFLQQLEPASPAYNIPGALRLSGPLDRSALLGALNLIVQRHESLRTTFQAVQGEPVQIIDEAVPVALPLVDLIALSAEQREATVQQISEAEARRVFNLACGPLLRLALLRLGEREHVLLFNMHHIVSDGWSVGILVRELSALYGGLCRGKPVSLEELPIQYADFAAWQRKWLQGPVLESQLAYWRSQLEGAPAVLDLPVDRPRPAAPTYRGTARVRQLGGELTAALRRLSRESWATLYMTLLASFKALLQRYAAGDDIVIGTNVANRTQLAVEGLIGFFANALALRTRLTGDPTFREALARVRETVLGAFAHQDLPFDRLVEDLQPRRDLSVSPVFQVVFDMGAAGEGSSLELEGLELSAIPIASATAKFDLTLTGQDLGDRLLLAVEINTEVLDEATGDSLLRHLETLLESIVREPEHRLSSLSLLRGPELDQLLVGLQGEVRDYPVDRTIHQLFEQQRAKTPAAVAAVHDGALLTYADLGRQASRMATLLRRVGIGPGSFVGILEERNLDFLTSILAIFKAGGAYVPIDPAYPEDRVRYMLADSGTSTLICRSQHLEWLCNLGSDCPELRYLLCLDNPAEPDAWSGSRIEVLSRADWEALPEEPDGVSSAPTDPAYMLYTSGSTGMPKGAVIRHDGAVNHIYAQFEALALGPELRFLQSAPSSSDISVWQFLAPLLIGGRTVIVSAETVSDPERLLRVLQTQDVTLIELVPAVLRAFLEHAHGLSAADRALPELRWMMATGEAVPVDLVNFWLRIYPGIKVVNAYGPTEASDDVTQAVIDSPLPAEVRSLSIGRPLANFACHIVDRHLQLVPLRVPGELCIAGIGVGNGYWRNPEKTAASFVPNPFARAAGEVLYRTGDLARWLPDGNLEFLGRLDHQVKVRGFRIELGEVEAALAAHPEVRECAVVARGDQGAAQLVAYMVAPEGQGLGTGELRSFLKARLPQAMIPSVFVILEEMPRTPNGKVDRRRLPNPAQAGSEKPFGMPPRTPVEKGLAEIWGEVLSLSSVSVEDDFFDLGGHSLLATRVLSRIRAAFEVELPLRAVFQYTTIALLAPVVEQARQAQSIATPTIRRVARQIHQLAEETEAVL
jgi:amino acid adenylation domain-containing protein